jgi:glycosyltransferase involved in cell wall biosynthesis
MHTNMNNHPLVSIIIDTYNSARFVIEALESAKAQTYQKIELIVSDDCSTDNTVQLCSEWIEENRNRFVRVVFNKTDYNTGIAQNLNRGLKSAKGEWVKFVAGDDALTSNCIEDNIFFVKTQANCYFVQSEVIFYKEFFHPNYLMSNDMSISNEFRNENITCELQYKILLFHNQNPLSVFYNLKAINNVGGFDESIPFLEDYPMWLRITKAGYRIFYFGKTTTIHRIRLNSESRPQESIIFNIRMHKSLKMVYKKYIYPELPLLNKTFRYIHFIMRDFIIYFNINKKKGFGDYADRLLLFVIYKLDNKAIKKLLKDILN